MDTFIYKQLFIHLYAFEESFNKKQEKEVEEPEEAQESVDDGSDFIFGQLLFEFI